MLNLDFKVAISALTHKVGSNLTQTTVYCLCIFQTKMSYTIWYSILKTNQSILHDIFPFTFVSPSQLSLTPMPIICEIYLFPVELCLIKILLVSGMTRWMNTCSSSLSPNGPGIRTRNGLRVVEQNMWDANAFLLSALQCYKHSKKIIRRVDLHRIERDATIGHYLRTESKRNNQWDIIDSYSLLQLSPRSFNTINFFITI